jgi:hypothetical protein
MPSRRFESTFHNFSPNETASQHNTFASSARPLYELHNVRQCIFCYCSYKKSTKCTNFSHLFLEWNYMFRTVPLSIIRSFSLYTQQWYMSYRFADSLWAGANAPAHKLSANLYDIPLLCVQWKTPDDGQRNCTKHVDFHSKIKIWEISASSWLCYKKFITIHGYMSVKFLFVYVPTS